jgi:hypothetical protein
MIRGGCACGGIRFEIEAVRSLTHCHCTICRKLTGAAFATYAHVEKAKFHWLEGEELISRYESTPGSFRYFCRICGSLVPGQAPYLATVSIPAGLLDDDPGVRPHVYLVRQWGNRGDSPHPQTGARVLKPKRPPETPACRRFEAPRLSGGRICCSIWACA